MKRSLIAVLLVTSVLAGCGQKKDDCIDPNTYENRCVEQALIREEGQQTIPSTSTPVPTYPVNPHYTPTHTHTTVIEREIIREQPKSSVLPAIGGAIGAWVGKKYSDRKAAQQAPTTPPVVAPSNPQRPPVRTIPIVPAPTPYVPPTVAPRPSYTPPRPTYVQPKPAYSAPPTVPLLR